MSFDLMSLFRIVSLLTVVYGTVAAKRPKRCETTEIDIAGHQGVKVEPVAMSRVDVNIEDGGISAIGDYVSFQFKTTSSYGIIFYARRYGNNAENIALSMKRGNLFYTIRCSFAHAHMRLELSRGVDDGRWHTVTFHRKGFQGYVEVDKKKYFRHYPVNCGGFNSFVFGGTEPMDTQRISKAVGKVAHFKGCFRNLESSVPFKSQISYNAVSVCK